MNLPIILASQSPRRTDILGSLGIQHTIEVADIDETPVLGESPEALVCRLAKEKALKVGRSHTKGFILGADTIVVCDHEILGKPMNASDAKNMLMTLSGRGHQVMTAVSLVNASTQIVSTDLAITDVRMKSLTESEIEAYIKTKEPMDKAGAYGIQGVGSVLVESIQGEFNTVVGLSVQSVIRLFEEQGLHYFRDLRQGVI